MKVIVVKDYEQMSDKAFEIMKQVVVANPSGVLGLATGTTPIGLYKNIEEQNSNIQGIYFFRLRNNNACSFF